ncbi:MAG TPA: hypothetical protein VMA86_02715 [Acetobacteraceae bacterium]|nr:hypothetical protein [Acetobacteraceae bacterium]
MSGTLRTFAFAQQWGPMAGFQRLVQGAVAAPAQGPWLPCGIFKSGSVEIEGSATTIAAAVRLANTLSCPLNGYTVQIGGTVTVGDVVSVTVTSSVAGSVTASHTVASGDTLNGIAASLAATLQANAALAAAGFIVNEGSAIVTMEFPSLAPGQEWQGGGMALDTFATAPPINSVSIAANVSGAATETATLGVVSNGTTMLTLSNSAPHSVLAGLPARWVQGVVTTLTGAGGGINVNFAGVA